MTGRRPVTQPEPNHTRSDVLSPLARVADVAETVPRAVERGCCTSYEIDRFGYVRINDIVVGQVKRNRRGRGYVVWMRGERTPHSFPGHNAIFASEDASARALVDELEII